jgi:pimeloyl-ACP methyl ester carboxylesterase
MLVLSRYPEFFHAYVGIGQVVDGEKAKMIAHRFIRTQAQKLGDHVALDAMAKRPNVVRENYLFKYGAELHNATSWVPFVWTGLAAPEYSLFDIMNIAKGPQFSNKHMKYNAIQGSLFEEITKVNVPLYFFCGKYDYVTPTELVQDYYQKLEAPSKHLVEFENSAHFAFYEEPQKFTETILMVLGETSK